MSKGDKLKAEAEAIYDKRNSSSVFSFLTGGGKAQKLEDAAEKFVAAGNQYKLANVMLSAGEVFTKAGDCLLEASADNASDAAAKYAEAGKCYKTISPIDAVTALQKAVDIYNDAGRFGSAARFKKEIAESFEADNNIEMAANSYQEANDLFVLDNKKSNGKQCLEKVAKLNSSDSATPEQLARAGAIFETMGKEAMETDLGKYSAKGHFLNCILCYLAAGDMVSVEHKTVVAKNTDYQFGACRECQFLEQLTEAVNNQNEEEFSTACFNFDRITPLDPWKTSLLTRAKRHIVSEGGDDEEEGDEKEDDVDLS